MNPLVIKALEWLGRGLAALKGLQFRWSRRLVRVKSWAKDLRALEERSGDTSGFAKLAAARDAGQGLGTLTAQEVIYQCEFKELFDKYFKRPLEKISDALDEVDDYLEDDAD